MLSLSLSKHISGKIEKTRHRLINSGTFFNYENQWHFISKDLPSSNAIQFNLSSVLTPTLQLQQTPPASLIFSFINY